LKIEKMGILGELCLFFTSFSFPSPFSLSFCYQSQTQPQNYNRVQFSAENLSMGLFKGF